MAKIAAIQMTSGMDLNDNLKMAKKLLEEAVTHGATVAVLPENFPLLGKGEEYKKIKCSIQETEGHGKIQDFLSHTARKLNLWIIGGTIPLTSETPEKSYAACLVYNAQGEKIARYNKLHLFDVTLNSQESYKESDTIVAGNNIVVVDTPVGRIGLSVCYDIRFPELFRELFKRGAEILIVPAAFTIPTGKAHWEILLRARAIENFCYVVAAAQWGTHGQGRETYGDSMIIAPYGEVITRLTQGNGVIIADIDLERVYSARRKIPVGEHQRIFIDYHNF